MVSIIATPGVKQPRRVSRIVFALAVCHLQPKPLKQRGADQKSASKGHRVQDSKGREALGPALPPARSEPRRFLDPCHAADPVLTTHTCSYSKRCFLFNRDLRRDQPFKIEAQNGSRFLARSGGAFITLSKTLVGSVFNGC